MPQILYRPKTKLSTFPKLSSTPVSTVRTSLNGVLVVEPQIFRDDRGHFLEIWRHDRYSAAGMPDQFVQDNVSLSTRGVVRGLHFQEPNAQGKLVSVLQGEIFDVAVDIRVGSPTFLRWEGVVLSGETGRQLYIPEGFAHGFAVLSDVAIVIYKCTRDYHPNCEQSVRWDDPAFGIAWPIDTPTLSPKDRSAPLLEQVASCRLPRYEAGL